VIDILRREHGIDQANLVAAQDILDKAADDGFVLFSGHGKSSFAI
jgi:hypothetical protein